MGVVLPVQMNKVSDAAVVPRRQKDEWHITAREHPCEERSEQKRLMICRWLRCYAGSIERQRGL